LSDGDEASSIGFDDSSLERGVWRYARATRARVVIDADDYFNCMQQAMLKARQRVLMIGWDFDTRIHLSRGRRWWEKGLRRTYPSRLGSFIPWLARHNDKLEIRILKWSYSILQFAARGSMALDFARWWPHKRIDFKFDTAHPVGCSHHQKIVVIDDKFAVCGGIDMTTRRWDTREHLPVDRRRKRPDDGLYGPWHDATMMLEGEVGEALEELGRARWVRAGGKPLKPPVKTEYSVWPEKLAADFENVEVGIARTRAEYDGLRKVDEIEHLFLQHIAKARHFIYAENQYFASRKIAEAMAVRLSEPDPPEIVIVHPQSADGWIEARAMDPARARLSEAVRALDTQDRFHLYVPYSDETPIYVHAKIMIVDDTILRIGSANFNNRSLGLDSECDVFIDCARQGNEHCAERIRALRHSLLAEHCGLEESAVGPLIEQQGSMAGMIASLGIERRRTLRPYHPDPPTELERELADRAMLDPEEPAELFEITPPDRGLFRRGSLLARSMRRLERKARRQ
jgi:phosphatidylserine/phosphatidylglycerophosphate/cardiolipin synthase-like enzyme